MLGTSYHERPEIGREVHCVISTTLMKEHDIGDDLGLRSLERTVSVAHQSGRIEFIPLQDQRQTH
jgi:hypothetical protein